MAVRTAILTALLVTALALAAPAEAGCHSPWPGTCTPHEFLEHFVDHGGEAPASVEREQGGFTITVGSISHTVTLRR